MKRFSELTAADKARTMHQWFPTEIKEILVFLQSTAKAIANESKRVEPQTIEKMFPYKGLKSVCNKVKEMIEGFENVFVLSGDFFAEKFFTEKNVTRFCIDCLKLYARVRPGTKLRECVQLFFVHENEPSITTATPKRKGRK